MQEVINQLKAQDWVSEDAELARLSPSSGGTSTSWDAITLPCQRSWPTEACGRSALQVPNGTFERSYVAFLSLSAVRAVYQSSVISALFRPGLRCPVILRMASLREAADSR